jgi:hypothetical protein
VARTGGRPLLCFGLAAGDSLLERLEAELQLLLRQTFRFGAEPHALELQQQVTNSIVLRQGASRSAICFRTRARKPSTASGRLSDGFFDSLHAHDGPGKLDLNARLPEPPRAAAAPAQAPPPCAMIGTKSTLAGMAGLAQATEPSCRLAPPSEHLLRTQLSAAPHIGYPRTGLQRLRQDPGLLLGGPAPAPPGTGHPPPAPEATLRVVIDVEHNDGSKPSASSQTSMVSQNAPRGPRGIAYALREEA